MVPVNHLNDTLSAIRSCSFHNLGDIQDHFHWSESYVLTVKRACLAAGLMTAEEWKALVPGRPKGLERHHRCPTCRWLNPTPSSPSTNNQESTY